MKPSDKAYLYAKRIYAAIGNYEVDAEKSDTDIIASFVQQAIDEAYQAGIGVP